MMPESWPIKLQENKLTEWQRYGNKAYEELYQKLETKKGENELLQIGKQRNRQSKDYKK